MNSYINELSEMVPTCNENPKKPDKLTVLRMAVDHIKHLRGTKTCIQINSKIKTNKTTYYVFMFDKYLCNLAEPTYEQQAPNPKTSSFLSERELKLLVLEVCLVSFHNHAILMCSTTDEEK